jgi:transposase
MPNEMLPSALAAPCLLAYVIRENVGKGLPLFRREDSFTRDGLRIDRGTLSRWKPRRPETGRHRREGHARAHLGHRILHLHRRDERVRAAHLQLREGSRSLQEGPLPRDDRRQGPHPVIYLEKETGPAIYERFRGFSGYVQADAKTVSNLFRGRTSLRRRSSACARSSCAPC